MGDPEMYQANVSAKPTSITQLLNPTIPTSHAGVRMPTQQSDSTAPHNDEDRPTIRRDKDHGLRTASWSHAHGTSAATVAGNDGLSSRGTGIDHYPEPPPLAHAQGQARRSSYPYAAQYPHGYTQAAYPTQPIPSMQTYEYPTASTSSWSQEQTQSTHPEYTPSMRYATDERSATRADSYGQTTTTASPHTSRPHNPQPSHSQAPPSPTADNYRGERASQSQPTQMYHSPTSFPPSLSYQQTPMDPSARQQSAQWQSGVRASSRIAARQSLEQGSGTQTFIVPDGHTTLQPVGQHHMRAPYVGPYPYPYAIPAPAYPGYAVQFSAGIVPAPPPAPVASKKRPVSKEEEEEETPKTKKSKNKKTEDSTASTSVSISASRRIQAHKASSTVKAPRNGTKPTTAESTAVAVDGNLTPELQYARCMSNRYRSENFPQCVSCTRRWAGDTCRFQSIRYFLKDKAGVMRGISFVDNQKEDGPSHTFPNKWNVPLEERHILRTKHAVAKALLPLLNQELEHIQTPPIISRPRESDVRATCDTCMTSLFSASYMCRSCGREACAECFAVICSLTRPPPDATPADIDAQQARREEHARTQPLTLACSRRVEHTAADFTPVSRFAREELQEAIKEMESLVAQQDLDGERTKMGGPSEFEASWTCVAMEDTASPSAGISAEANSHPTCVIPYHALTESLFQRVWSEGNPLVVTGILEQMQLKWDPAFFIDNYGDQSATLTDCNSETTCKKSIRDFFSWFGNYEGRDKHCWKLKDWPSSMDFKTAFPELYEDFNRAVPAPSYVRRDGAFNVAAHFPSNSIGPDLGAAISRFYARRKDARHMYGPKMYNALATTDGKGTLGTTRLHMDMSDAFNVMTFAAPLPDTTDDEANGAKAPGYAVWDIYKASDAGKLRQFLRELHGGGLGAAAGHDPIHAQTYYLDAEQRQLLFERHGVKSHRIFQRPGEGVFIPAGCAHQVLNLADCIKVAIDFVSPENIARCAILTEEFREQNTSQIWKEDVLQLKTMMWYAWLSCRRQEKKATEKEAATMDDAVVAAAAAT